MQLLSKDCASNEMWSHNFGIGLADLGFLKLKGYIEKANEEITLRKASPASSSTLSSKENIMKILVTGFTGKVGLQVASYLQ